MCISSFIHPSLRGGGGGGGDMVLKRHPPPSSLPFQWLSVKKTETKNNNNNNNNGMYIHGGSNKESTSSISSFATSSSCESPRSVLENTSEGLEKNRINSNRVGLAIVVAFEVEDEAIAILNPHTLHYKALSTPPISVQHSHKANDEEEKEEEEEEEEEDDGSDDDDEEEDRERERERERVNIVPSIFSVGSPLFGSSMEDDYEEEEEEEGIPWPLLTEEALKACFLCKRSFEDGKDIYIYRGDQAFCSEECRYQQVALDESWHSDGPPLLY